MSARKKREDKVMLEFQKIQKNSMLFFKPWFKAQGTHIGDYSLGFQFMWQRALSLDYAVYGDCLLLKETYAGKTYFYYPLSKTGDFSAEERALDEIERYCRDGEIRLHFTNIPREKLGVFLARYGRDVTVTNNRRWRDYLYRTEDFCAYGGGKYAGQRNHVHKFEKLYPMWRFCLFGQGDVPRVEAFLREYESSQRSKHAYLADEEMDEVYEILPHMAEFGFIGGILEAEGRPVAFTAGELCGDMLVVHIEKALREYEGAYPMVAMQLARAVQGRAAYLNRMDDAGDPGLRKSKLQYHPAELVDKFNLAPRRAIDGLSRLPELTTARLTLAPVADGDAKAYARLAADVERNRYWGYDWRADYTGETPPPDDYFIMCAREDFREKREMPLGVYLDGELIGEAVLHRFGYRDDVEVGVRLLPEAEGNGYAREAVRALAEYAFLKLSVERVEAKCFKENLRSRAMLLGAGLKPCGEDAVYYYFSMTPAD